MRKRVMVAAMLASLAVSPASAGIIYTLTPETLGPLTATGTITTDGNLGILTAADITNVNITVTGDAPGVTINQLGLFTGPSGNAPTALSATTTALSFDFFGTIENTLTFVGAGAGGYELVSNHGFLLANSSGADFTANGVANFVLASVSPAPGPVYGAGLPGLAFAAGGLFLWSRRKQARAAL